MRNFSENFFTLSKFFLPSIPTLKVYLSKLFSALKNTHRKNVWVSKYWKFQQLDAFLRVNSFFIGLCSSFCRQLWMINRFLLSIRSLMGSMHIEELNLENQQNHFGGISISIESNLRGAFYINLLKHSWKPL